MSQKPQSQNHNDKNPKDIRHQLRETVEHFEHFLPAQASIKDFVHHNTLHGFQHLPFQEAVVAAEGYNGACGFLEEKQFRKFYQQGRINDTDLVHVLKDDKDFVLEEIFFQYQACEITIQDLLLTFLVYPFSNLTDSQLSWQIEEINALESFQDEVKSASRDKLIKYHQAESGNYQESQAIHDLWDACLEKLELEHFILHPEEMLDLSIEQINKILKITINSDEDSAPGHHGVHRKMQKQANIEFGTLISQVGTTITLRGLLQALTGEDILDEIRPLMIRYVSSYLDEGMAAWNQDRTKGFYQRWRSNAHSDLLWVFDTLPDWHDTLESLPDESIDVVIQQLQFLDLPQERWCKYLDCLVMELPGWSGMFLWRQNNPGYAGLHDIPVEMMDYLAVRLVLERLFAKRLCSEQWQFDANLDMFRWYFRRHRSEFLVRYSLFNKRLPEYLTTQAQRQLERARHGNVDNHSWQSLGDVFWTWQHTPAAGGSSGFSIFNHAWKLFYLAQHLGMNAGMVRKLTEQQIQQIFQCLDILTKNKRGFIWLQAYEHHYREQILNMLVNNKNRGNWRTRESRPEAQTVFCMDEREEAFRRHLEELNPNIETLGAAAHFNVFIDWKGADDDQLTTLCPVVAVPAHEIHEKPAPNYLGTFKNHKERYDLRHKFKNLLHQESHRNLLSSALLIAAAAPGALLLLLGKILAPLKTGQSIDKTIHDFEGSLPTDIEVTCKNPVDNPTPDNHQIGFTNQEQADRVEALLRNMGLLDQFAPLVVIFGHGSISQNNPHLAAYDCGACSGRHSGPNARTYAVAANRPEVRAILSERGITIPEDSWFLGAEHNTCDESITWYDLEKVPEHLQSALKKLKGEIFHVSQLSAHERCRRLASAPKNPSIQEAFDHIVGRSYDITQARPELGHATNAVAFIGRRSLTQSAFLDRRGFLISYDPTTDHDGTVIERLLLANGPVGAGISLEYYFSTINNDIYGSGSKITHNVSGWFGVMDGTNSDLRTGLPRQMIEIHEAMRLQVIVEAKVDMLTEIYGRQPALQELIGNGWILVCAIDPDSGEISEFKIGQGFVPWQGDVRQLPTVEKSIDWYDGIDYPLAPALIAQKEAC